MKTSKKDKMKYYYNGKIKKEERTSESLLKKERKERKKETNKQTNKD